MKIELQTPVEMLKRWQGIECTCDPDVGHICEVCHDIQVVKGLMAENQRLREALDDIENHSIDLAPAMYPSEDLANGYAMGVGSCRRIAREALRQAEGGER